MKDNVRVICPGCNGRPEEVKREPYVIGCWLCEGKKYVSQDEAEEFKKSLEPPDFPEPPEPFNPLFSKEELSELFKKEENDD